MGGLAIDHREVRKLADRTNGLGPCLQVRTGKEAT